MQAFRFAFGFVRSLFSTDRIRSIVTPLVRVVNALILLLVYLAFMLVPSLRAFMGSRSAAPVATATCCCGPACTAGACCCCDEDPRPEQASSHPAIRDYDCGCPPGAVTVTLVAPHHYWGAEHWLGLPPNRGSPLPMLSIPQTSIPLEPPAPVPIS